MLAGPDQEVDMVLADVADRDGIDALFDELEARLPRLDIFAANAGTGRVTPFLDLSTQEWDDVVALNLTGTTYCCQRAARLMRNHPAPNMSIIVVSSIRALGARSGRLAYSATKAAVNQMVRVAALDLAPLGIRVNALSPGITDTPLTAANPDAFAEAVAGVPLGRAGLPEDIAEGALFLASPQARFVTGINLVVDGGESLNA
ncbi:MAG: SDR family NAD(P)-dependent oxidoreductase [Acidimicrobiales bacterium]